MSSQVQGLRRFVGSSPRNGWQPSTVPVVVVAGAVGGAGTSTVATLLALTIADTGRRTLLIDTDEMVGAIHRMLDVPAPLGLSALLDPSVPLSDVLVSVAADCHLLPGGEAPLARGGPMDPSGRRTVMRRAAQAYPDYDAVVIDAGSRLDGVIAAGEGGTSRLLVVTGVTPVAIASAYAVVKTAEARWPGVPVDVLFNRQEAALGRTAFEQVHQAARHFLGRSVGFAGVVPSDDSLKSAPDFPLRRCRRDTALALQQLAASLLTETSNALPL